MINGKIFNIQRFSIHDGPGIRTVIFFSGCNLACRWCHNPESIAGKPQLEFYGERCISCGKCFDICPNNAHLLRNGSHVIDRSKCEICLKCADFCYAEAIVPVGREISLEQLEKAIATDEEYFKQSVTGGVTFSGGEPMLQVDFLEKILKSCKDRGIHTAIDTAGAVPFEYFERVIPYCGIFLYDIKAFNSEVHKQLTGISNEIILSNLKKLSESSSDIWIRIPVIKGGKINNIGNIDEMQEIAMFLKDIKITKCELLPYHKLGDGKYKSLGLIPKDFETPSENDMTEIRAIFAGNQIETQ